MSIPLFLLSFIGFVIFIILGFVSKFKKNGKAKKNFIITGVCFVIMIISFASIPTPDDGAEQAIANVDSENGENQKEDVKADKQEDESQKNELADEEKTAQAEQEVKEKAEQKAKDEAVAKAKSEEEAKAKAKEESVPREYKSALKKAETYAKTMHMSKAGIYDQLTSEYGEGFPAEAAQYAIDNIVFDWKESALKKAQTYAESMSMSDSAIYDQLISEYGEKFTPEEAQYAIDNLE